MRMGCLFYRCIIFHLLGCAFIHFLWERGMYGEVFIFTIKSILIPTNLTHISHTNVPTNQQNTTLNRQQKINKFTQQTHQNLPIKTIHSTTPHSPKHHQSKPYNSSNFTSHNQSILHESIFIQSTNKHFLHQTTFTHFKAILSHFKRSYILPLPFFFYTIKPS